MRSFELQTALLLLLSVSLAHGSTLVDLVSETEILKIGELNVEEGVLDLVVRFHRVDMERSATGYFAESFMEYEGSSKMRIPLEGISVEEVSALAEGCMISIHYFSVSGLYMSEEGDPEGFSQISWTYLGETEGISNAPVSYTISSL